MPGTAFLICELYLWFVIYELWFMIFDLEGKLYKEHLNIQLYQ